MTENRNLGGRPPLPKGEGKSSYIGFRVLDEDRKQMESAAKAAGLKLSDWCRSRLVKAVKKDAKG